MRQVKKIRKRVTTLLVMTALLLSLGMVTGIFTGNIITAEAAAMKLNVKSAELVPNESLSLSITNVGKKKVFWRSSNKKVASVTAKGKVTAKNNVGESCTITAKAGKKSFKCKISVVKEKLCGTYIISYTNTTTSGTAADGKTFVENARVECIDVKRKKDGYYMWVSQAHNYDVTDYMVQDEEENYIGKKLPECLVNPENNVVNMFMDVNGKIVFETYKEYDDDSWNKRMKELGW